MTSNPSGTVTFLVTDIENSTQLVREHPETWEIAKARQHTISRGNSLMATSRSEFGSNARCTVAMPPRPISPLSRYLPVFPVDIR